MTETDAALSLSLPSHESAAKRSAAALTLSLSLSLGIKYRAIEARPALLKAANAVKHVCKKSKKTTSTAPDMKYKEEVLLDCKK